MSEIDSSLVYKGFWINRSYGTILGATITTDNASGNVIVAFLAIIVSIATGHLWNLFLFAIYQMRSDTEHSDGLFLQQQVLIRSLPSPGTAFLDFTRLGWAWRAHTLRPLNRSVVFAVFSLVYAIAALISGIFSSYVVSSSHIEVLAHNSGCSSINLTTLSSGESEYVVKVTGSAEQYSDTCYTVNNVPSQCEIYVKPRIDFKISTDNCPFESQICRNSTPPAVVLDSGLLDSNYDFGINASPKQRVKFRRKSVCAPLVTEGYSSFLTTSEYYSHGLESRPLLPGEVFYTLTYFSGNASTNVTFIHSSVENNITLDYAFRQVHVLSQLHCPAFFDSFAEPMGATLDGYLN